MQIGTRPVRGKVLKIVSNCWNDTLAVALTPQFDKRPIIIVTLSTGASKNNKKGTFSLNVLWISLTLKKRQ